jgi:hypothetical protein
MQKNIVFVTYKPDTHFDAAILRTAAEKADAEFVLIQIVARGNLVEEGSKHYLVAGDDKFLLVEPPADKPLPAPSKDVLSVIGTIDDSQPEMRLKVIQARLPQE